MTNEEKNIFMRRSIELSIGSVASGGGPFGAVIVKNGEIVGEGINRVTVNNDPTAHAEVMAIRNACERLGTFDLSGCEIFSSCEPCPMCLSAIYWAHLDAIYYGNNRQDAAEIGFDDDMLYREIPLDPKDRHKPMKCLLPEEAVKAFDMWKENPDKKPY